MKVMIIDGNSQYRRMFEEAGWTITLNFQDADLIQFTGGADVSPFLYGEAIHPTTYNDPRRDLVESGYYAWGVRLKKKMAGICRGGQFLNVMNGGSMYQDVDNHCRSHYLVDRFTEEKHLVTSTHHQMMIPSYHGEVIAQAFESTTLKHMVKGEEVVLETTFADVEVVWYDKTNSLCFQPHPEFGGADSTRKYYFELLERYLKV